MRNSLIQQLQSRIDGLPAGAVFSVTDFIDIAKPKTVSKMLTRLQEEGKTDRVLRSVFWKKDETKEHPNPNLVAEALARENKWSLAPSGNTALYLLGVTDEVPAVWTYVTDGTYRTYSLGKHSISFTHATGVIHKMSDKTKLVVQALKACGSKMSDETFRKIYKCAKKWNLKNIASETKTAAVWIRKTTAKMMMLQDIEGVQ